MALPHSMKLEVESGFRTRTTLFIVYSAVVLSDGRVARTYLERPLGAFCALIGTWTVRIYSNGRLRRVHAVASLVEAEHLICSLGVTGASGRPAPRATHRPRP